MAITLKKTKYLLHKSEAKMVLMLFSRCCCFIFHHDSMVFDWKKTKAGSKHLEYHKECYAINKRSRDWLNWLVIVVNKKQLLFN